MSYEKPTIAPLVVTDTPLCLADVTSGATLANCDCECMCVEPCPCQCTCESPCDCMSPCSFMIAPMVEAAFASVEETRGLQVSPLIHLRVEDFGALAFDTRTWKSLKLNPSGYEVIRRIAEGIDLEQLTDELCERQPELRGAVEKDVLSFLRQLQQLGIVHGSPDKQVA